MNIKYQNYLFLRFKMYKINGYFSLKGPFWQKRENELYFTCSKEFSSISFIFPCDDLCFTGFTHHKWFCHCKRPCENGFKSPRFNQFNCFQMILIAWVGELVQIRISSFAMGFPWIMANSCKYEKKNKQLWRFLIRNTFKKIGLGPIYLQFLLK